MEVESFAHHQPPLAIVGILLSSGVGVIVAETVPVGTILGMVVLIGLGKWPQ